MSGKSKKRSGSSSNNAKARKAAGKADAGRPIDEEMWGRARSVAQRYQLVISPAPEVGFLGRTAELPLVMADGATIEACAKATLEATALAIVSMLERAERPPSPASDGRREVQLNIRLSADERERIEESARKSGYRSISDFVRTAALDKAG